MTEAARRSQALPPSEDPRALADGVKLDLERYVPGMLLWLSNKISSSASSLYREKFAITVVDWRLLSYFKIHPWSTASRACELMGLDKAAASRSIALLSENGWLERRPCGLRKVEYRVTRPGNKLHNAVFKFAMAREQALLEGFSEQEVDLLIGLLKRMLGNIDVVHSVGRGAVRRRSDATPRDGAGQKGA